MLKLKINNNIPNWIFDRDCTNITVSINAFLEKFIQDPGSTLTASIFDAYSTTYRNVTKT